MNMYSFLILIGFVVSFLLMILKAKQKKIDSWDFILFFPIVVIVGLLGARWLTYLTSKDSFFKASDPFKFPYYELSGLSINGGFLFAFLITLFYLFFLSKKRKISLWVFFDIIVINILIGQAIGRWGNWHNHELFGVPLQIDGKEFKNNWFYCDWFWKRLLPKSNIPHAPHLIFNHIYHHPLFLYESMLNLIGWLAFGFVLPNLHRWFNPRPWIKEVAYCEKLFNDNWTRLLEKSDYPYLRRMRCILKRYCVYKTKKQMWIEHDTNFFLKTNTKLNLSVFQKPQFDKSTFFIVKYWYFFKAYMIYLFTKDCRALINIHKQSNPYRRFNFKAGLIGSCYFIWYGLVRFGLDFVREKEGKFWPDASLDLSQYISIIYVALGIFLIIFSQWIAPYRWRNIGWTYEQKYSKIVQSNI